MKSIKSSYVVWNFICSADLERANGNHIWWQRDSVIEGTVVIYKHQIGVFQAFQIRFVFHKHSADSAVFIFHENVFAIEPIERMINHVHETFAHSHSERRGGGRAREVWNEAGKNLCGRGGCQACRQRMRRDRDERWKLKVLDEREQRLSQSEVENDRVEPKGFGVISQPPQALGFEEFPTHKVVQLVMFLDNREEVFRRQTPWRPQIELIQRLVHVLHVNEGDIGPWTLEVDAQNREIVAPLC